MYSDKENVNILTQLLAEYGVRHAVVCPGSRNSPIVHNLNEHPDILCHPATDERSAAFLALGMMQSAPEQLVAVCVTSGTALLNTLPAVAEADYQHLGIIIISADRPQQWIGQLDGQTIPQQGALTHFAAKSITLPEPTNEEEYWFCNRIVNEALTTARDEKRPVHINVPISEPLFEYNTTELPLQRCIETIDWSDESMQSYVFASLYESSKAMIVLGQMGKDDVNAEDVDLLSEYITTIYEPISCNSSVSCIADWLMATEEVLTADYQPEILLYAGGNTISKRLRRFMRNLPASSKVIMVNEKGLIEDVSQHATAVIKASNGCVLSLLAAMFAINDQHQTAFHNRWNQLKLNAIEHRRGYRPAYSSMLAVKLFEENVTGSDIVHYANSSAIRLAAIYADHYVFCNRGINGIEGSVSTAAGMALAMAGKPEGNIYCIVGDLSFFYDQNALWQQQLGSNFRILLLNNGGGSIFRSLRGLEESPARDLLVSAAHNTSAEGICQQFRISYDRVTDESQLEDAILRLTSQESDRPMLLEVFTSAAADSRCMKDYLTKSK